MNDPPSEVKRIVDYDVVPSDGRIEAHTEEILIVGINSVGA